MADPIRFHLVDDDNDFLDLVEALIRDAGHQVTRSDDPKTALEDVVREQPTCVLLDIMMPGVDGLDLCIRLREAEELGGLPIVVVSAKTYEFDRQRARQLGADGYITKPIRPDDFIEQLMSVIADDMSLTFWGVRGTLPVPGEETNRYGGNTSCVTLALPRDRLFIFDAGTGIKKLSDSLTKSGRSRIEASIFFSHPHWGPHQLFAVFHAALCSRQPLRHLRLQSWRHLCTRPSVGADGWSLFPGNDARVRRQRGVS